MKIQSSSIGPKFQILLLQVNSS